MARARDDQSHRRQADREVIVLVMARTTAASIARAATIAERAAVRRFFTHQQTLFVDIEIAAIMA